MPIWILKIKISIFVIKKINIIIIDINTYCVACKLKKAWVFTISIRVLEYSVQNKARQENDLKMFILKEYQDFLNLFSEKTQIYSFYIKNIIKN